MDRNNRHGKRHHNSWKNQKNHSEHKEYKDFKEHKEPVRYSNFQHVTQENLEAQKKREQAILEFKSKEVVCPKCGQVITDMASAMADKASGSPIHFECVMAELEKSETLERNEKICYIGQGRFGVLYFENPRDQRHFTIKKIIDWEGRDQKNQWREEMSGLYSQIE